jgi:hypothetical protein
MFFNEPTDHLGFLANIDLSTCYMLYKIAINALSAGYADNRRDIQVNISERVTLGIFFYCLKNAYKRFYTRRGRNYVGTIGVPYNL